MLMMVWGGLEPNHPIIVPDNSDPGIAHYSTVLYYTALLYYTVLLCTILYSTAVIYSTVYCILYTVYSTALL